MSYSHSTSNYGLPKFQVNDKPSFLTDWNTAMDNIDSELSNNHQQASQASEDAANALNKANSASSNASSALSKANTNATDISDLEDRVSSLESSSGGLSVTMKHLSYGTASYGKLDSVSLRQISLGGYTILRGYVEYTANSKPSYGWNDTFTFTSANFMTGDCGTISLTNGMRGRVQANGFWYATSSTRIIVAVNDDVDLLPNNGCEIYFS